jgi:CRP/FNR family transcriptional regulator, cyclic AMP receptor protein
MTGKNADAIRALPLVAGLEPETVNFLVERMQEVAVPIGGHIVKQGDFAYRFFVIMDGSASVSRDGRALAALKAGDVFGEMGVIDDARRNADVIAVTPMRLLALMAWDFRDVVSRSPKFREMIETVVAKRS